jgi:predicted transposase YbfD/YdcC
MLISVEMTGNEGGNHAFREDNCRARTGGAPENLATLRKLALQIISEQQDKLSMKKRRLRADYDTEYLKRLIT